MEEKSCAAKMEKTMGSFSFTVEGWSALPDKVGESTESPEFDLCGKSWQLRIFPGGSLEAHSGHVSFYLASKSNTLIRASYKLIIKNQNHSGNDEVFASAGIRKFEAKGVQVDGWGRDKFIAASQLKDAWVGLCVNDVVIFKVEITVFGGLGPISPTSSMSGEPIPTLSQSFLRALQNPEHSFSDLTIVVNQESIRVHKCILAARSPIFQSMLTLPLAESRAGTITINDFDTDVIQAMISFIYTDVISNFATLDSMLLNLYAAASKYQVVGLMSICEARMIEVINVANCLDIYKVADLFEAVKLKSSLMHFIIQHYVEVCATEQYKYIVGNYHQDDQCKRIFNDLNTAVANSQVYRSNCLNLIGMHGAANGNGHPDNNKSSESGAVHRNSTCIIS